MEKDDAAPYRPGPHATEDNRWSGRLSLSIETVSFPRDLSVMLLQVPGESPYDLRFRLFGFSIRVAWTFWLGAVVFGYALVDGIDMMLGMDSPGRMPLLLLWGVCLFVSILIHELGHAFAFRLYGIESSVVLYHFGGLAVPRTSFGGSRGFAPMNLGAGPDLLIAAAGPLAQLVSALLLVGLFMAFDYRIEAFRWMPGGLDRLWPAVLEGRPIENAGLFALVTFYTFPSVLWALLNLVPVWPLDGGRIARSVVVLAGGPTEWSLWISLVTAAAMAVYGFQSGALFLGILFLSLAVSNFQLLQMRDGWRY